VNVTFFGRHCRFSARVLSALLEHGHHVGLIVLPGRPGTGARIAQSRSAKPRLSLTPVDRSVAVLPTVSSLAWSAGVKVAEVSREELESVPQRYRELSTGILVSACYPWQLPENVLDAPPAGAINVHPSLLPAHRGPDPVFWTLRAGDRMTGSTIHQMTGRLDAGPILAQQPLEIPLRIRYHDLEQQLVDLGARLLYETLDRIATGASRAVEQPDSDVSFEDFPGRTDLRIDPTWPAERAFRFVYGVGASHGPITLLLPDGKTHLLNDALALRTGTQSRPTESDGAGRVAVQFSDGVVVFRESTPGANG
jgi:methionyl-tRNA formyltransferase